MGRVGRALATAFLVCGLVHVDAQPVGAQGLGDFLKNLGETLDEFDSDVRKSLGVEPYQSKNPKTQQQGRPPATTPPAVQASSYNNNRQFTAAAQAMLTSLGYNPGPVDGAYGGKTRVAIQQFQKDTGVPQTGNVSPALLQALERAGGVTNLMVSAPKAASPATGAGVQAAAGSVWNTRVEGIWTGSFVCGQGRTMLRLTVYRSKTEQATGLFEFTLNNGAYGSFRFAGIYDRQSGVISAKPTMWVQRPGRQIQFVPFTARVSPDARTMVGRINYTGCGELAVQRATEPKPDTPSYNNNRQYTAAAQAMLTSLGYEPGPVDGAYGGKTRVAIQLFQQDVGHPQTGDVSPQLLQALKDAGGVTDPAVPAPPPAPPTQLGQPLQAVATQQARGSVDYSKFQAPSADACKRASVLKERILNKAIELGRLYAAANCSKSKSAMNLLSSGPYAAQRVHDLAKLGEKIGPPEDDVYDKVVTVFRASAKEWLNQFGGNCPSYSRSKLKRAQETAAEEFSQELQSLGPVSMCGAPQPADKTVAGVTAPPADQPAPPVPAASAPAKKYEQSKVVRWLRPYRLALRFLNGTEISANDPAIAKALKRQIEIEQRAWYAASKLINVDRKTDRRTFALAWQSVKESDPQLANGPMLDLFADHAADWSFFAQQPGFVLKKPEPKSDIDRLLQSEAKKILIQPEAFVFARDAIVGRDIGFVGRELAPLYVEHLRRVAERAPTRMKFKTELVWGAYDSDNQTMPLFSGYRGTERPNSGLFPLLNEGPMDKYLKPAKTADNRFMYYVWQSGTPSTVLANTEKRSKPGAYGYDTPVRAWRDAVLSLVENQVAYWILALDRRLVLPPFRMEARQAEAITQQQAGTKSAYARRNPDQQYYMIVTVDVVSGSTILGDQGRQIAFPANLVGVEIFGPGNQSIASYDPDDFPLHTKGVAKRQVAKRQAAGAAQRKKVVDDRQAEAKRLDVIGIEIGMTLEEAEGIIQDNLGLDPEILYTKEMQVWKTNGKFDNRQRQSFQLSHGIVYTARDYSQHITVYIDPTSPSQTVIAAARYLDFGGEQVASDAVAQLLTNKYGPPTRRNNNSMVWDHSAYAHTAMCFAGQAASDNNWFDESGTPLSELNALGHSKVRSRAAIYRAANGDVEEAIRTCEDAVGAGWSDRGVMTWLVNPLKARSANRAIAAAVKADLAKQGKKLEKKLKF